MKNTLSLAAPPRSLPLSLRVRVALGGVMMMVGWIVMGIGLLLSVTFVGQSELWSAGRFDGPLNTTDGRVLRTERTNMEVNGRYVIAVHFEYMLGDRPQQGVSYARGQVAEEGSTIVVEYARNDPRAARIRGMDSAPFPAGVGFVLIMPIIGLGFLVYGCWRGLRNLHLLSYGQLTYGRLLHKEPTNTRINNQRVYRLTFEFVDDLKQRREVVARSHRPETLEDQAMEPLLYDPGSTAAVLFDAVPGKARVDRDGLFEPVSALEMLRVLALPVLAAVLAWVGTLIAL